MLVPQRKAAVEVVGVPRKPSQQTFRDAAEHLIGVEIQDVRWQVQGTNIRKRLREERNFTAVNDQASSVGPRWKVAAKTET